MPLDEPLFIIKPYPVKERLAEVLHRLERAHPQQLLIKSPDKLFRDTIAFLSVDECGTRCDTQESEFGLEVTAHILTTMIMAHLQTRCDAGRDAPELLAHPVTNRLHCLKAGGPLRCMNADPFEGTMIHADEDRDGSVRHRAGRIGAPHLIRPLRHDVAVVDSWPHDTRHPTGRQEMGLPHESAHAGFGRANPLRPQARPHFAVPLPKKRGGGQDLVGGQGLLTPFRRLTER
jgi:hypothetical protein